MCSVVDELCLLVIRKRVSASTVVLGVGGLQTHSTLDRVDKQDNDVGAARMIGDRPISINETNDV